ncbi:hypothetical protein Mal4_48080 [Maioricimonas rarisocia]|uniref:Uncharacterized protein n=1 Tax=Maioricimonas rarisocia TaxID=2528026 RepID=A0A517ZDB0_9PLAN|nr:hypothetical protein [Maioricimonas rarisocia]QDU40451.1 hypothetical protein Mal4_48080 [Maioricimonas rarisocia]
MSAIPESLPADLSEQTVVRPQRLKNPLRGQMSLFRGLSAGFALLAAVTLPVGISGIGAAEPTTLTLASMIAGVMSATVAVICTFVLACLAWYLGRYDGDLARLEAGHYLAHWTYGDDEWQRYVATEFHEARRTAFYGTVIFGAFGGIISIIAAVQGFQVAGSTLLGLAVPTLVGLAAGFVLGGFLQFIEVRRCRRLQTHKAETYVGETGLYFDENYRPWSMLGQSLSSVVLNEERSPAILAFTFRMTSNNGDTYHEVRVPVPNDRLAEADDIVELLGN